MIASQKEFAIAKICESKSKHTPKFMQALDSPFLIGVDDYFSV